MLSELLLKEGVRSLDKTAIKDNSIQASQRRERQRGPGQGHPEFKDMSFNSGFIAYDLYDLDQVDYLPWASISSFISGKGLAMTLALPGQWAVPTLSSSASMSYSWPSSFPTGDPGSVGFLPAKSKLSRHQTVCWDPSLFLYVSESHTDSPDPNTPSRYHEASVHFPVRRPNGIRRCNRHSPCRVSSVLSPFQIHNTNHRQRLLLLNGVQGHPTFF